MGGTLHTAMVLCAGLGTRMATPANSMLPKPLVQLQGKALIDHVLDRLAAARIARAVVNVHHKADLIEQQWKAQQKAIADLIEQQRNGKIADQWEAQRKAITDRVEQQWNAQLKAITDLAERQWDAQKKAIEDAQNAIGGVFRPKPE